MKRGWLAAALAPLCACSQLAAEPPETLTCRTLPSPDGARELRYEVEAGPAFRDDVVRLLVCDAAVGCQTAYTQTTAGWFGAAWEGRRQLVIVAASRKGRAEAHALDVETRLVRIPRAELRLIPLRLSTHGQFVTNLWDSCAPAAADDSSAEA